MAAGLSDKISKQVKTKTRTVCFVGIIASGLLSDCYYNVGGASDITAFKTGNST